MYECAVCKQPVRLENEWEFPVVMSRDNRGGLTQAIKVSVNCSQDCNSSAVTGLCFQGEDLDKVIDKTIGLGATTSELVLPAHKA